MKRVSLTEYLKGVLSKAGLPSVDFPVRVSLYILVPFIFSGVAFLSFYIAYQGGDARWDSSLMWRGAAILLFATFSGVVITMTLINPVKRFIDTVKRAPAFPRDRDSDASRAHAFRMSDFGHYNHVFKEVTNLISKIDARERFPEIEGQSVAIRGVLSQVIKVAPTDTTVLILGESGVGKECIADAIYRESDRLGKPFVKLNCVAIPSGLLESELFGHEKGAFTGAQGRKTGKFEVANGGTLFLDEIGDMPLETQAKLLRVLQERQFERVGGNQSIEVDVRFIAASNKNLQRMVAEGDFREDLYYRLDVFSIYVPPLRDRIEDVPLLARRMLQDMPVQCELTSNAMRELMTWTWPGNVRELKNVLERAAVMAEDGLITTTGLSSKMRPGIIAGADSSDLPGELFDDRDMDHESFNLDNYLARSEKEMILQALKKTAGVQSKAARLLGINQRSLWHRIKKYGIDIKSVKRELM